MDFNFDLKLVQSQKLLLTPQLKQALEILKMTSQELFEYVEEELEKNPVLEAFESNGNTEEKSSIDSLGTGWDEYDGYGRLTDTYDEEIKYIIPDIIVKKIGGKFEIVLNDDAIPLIGINEYYKRISEQKLSNEAAEFLKGKMDSAVWLIKCIEQRKSTLRKVAEGILSCQLEFFEFGKQHLKPLTKKETADRIGMHESTISRAINSKYIQCKFGVFEMRYFFSGKIPLASGEMVASQNIKEELKEIIRNEDRKHPLSDGKIAAIFNSKGLKISRRTVARYRSELEIPAIYNRRKL